MCNTKFRRRRHTKLTIAIIVVVVIIPVCYFGIYSLYNTKDTIKSDFKILRTIDECRKVIEHTIDKKEMEVDKELSQIKNKTKKYQLSVSQSVQENNYFCMPTCAQMVLRYHNIIKTQKELAEEMNTVPVTGTEYVDFTKIVNKYLYNKGIVENSEIGYHIQTIAVHDTNPVIEIEFMNRVRNNILTNDPIFVAINLQELYPTFPKVNHMILITGYKEAEETGRILEYYYIDPYYGVLDDVYGGLKVATNEELMNAVITNDEPAYIW